MKETPGNGSAPEVSSASAKVVKSSGRPLGSSKDLGAGASAQAKRLATAILEVLAGTRTPMEAAQALGVSLPRYYLLEVRALQGMLVACEPRCLGRQATAESALAALRRECEQLRRDCIRQQTLVRAAQRTIGLTAVVAPQRKPAKNGRRRSTARALRAAARLRVEEAAGAAADTEAMATP